MVILIRGLPGSGKSTLAKMLLKKMPKCKNYEADMYFIKDGIYSFKPEQLNNAHKWCYEKTVKAINNGFNVIVSNTFTTNWEMEKYTKLPVSVFIFECTGEYKNIHNVPESAIKKMADRWEAVSLKNIKFCIEQKGEL